MGYTSAERTRLWLLSKLIQNMAYSQRGCHINCIWMSSKDRKFPSAVMWRNTLELRYRYCLMFLLLYPAAGIHLGKRSRQGTFSPPLFSTTWYTYSCKLKSVVIRTTHTELSHTVLNEILNWYLCMVPKNRHVVLHLFRALWSKNKCKHEVYYFWVQLYSHLFIGKLDILW